MRSSIRHPIFQKEASVRENRWHACARESRLSRSLRDTPVPTTKTMTTNKRGHTRGKHTYVFSHLMVWMRLVDVVELTFDHWGSLARCGETLYMMMRERGRKKKRHNPPIERINRAPRSVSRGMRTRENKKERRRMREMCVSASLIFFEFQCVWLRLWGVRKLNLECTNHKFRRFTSPNLDENMKDEKKVECEPNQKIPSVSSIQIGCHTRINASDTRQGTGQGNLQAEFNDECHKSQIRAIERAIEMWNSMESWEQPIWI